MGWVLLAGALVVAVVVALPLIGALYPAHALAMTIIKQELEKARVHPTTFSEECRRELADYSIESAKRNEQFKIRQGSWRSNLRQAAETTVWSVMAIVMGDKSFTAEDIKRDAADGIASPVWEILAKHDPQRFSLDHLEQTQLTNLILRDEHYRAR